ncbi:MULTISPECIES: SAV_6107 family HEPN domain-containing protein [Amycolatopsis]|uniref:SAV_6107 family HEPN domain-containing protein n=1 Tax=Amycolatopsis TaxID=1813 RepID=UPI001F3B5199|nr:MULTISPECIES: SAV_6107 family HEPN domain-containing protein [Amycolatopsis]UKD55501.1 SAV_6107 family HEPN domain-containing protein [Amycolatopsis sp. FU40]
MESGLGSSPEPVPSASAVNPAAPATNPALPFASENTPAAAPQPERAPTPKPTVHHVPEAPVPSGPPPRQVVHRTRAAVRPSAEPSARRSGAKGQPQLPLSLRPPAPPEAVALLAQANRGLDHAENERDPAERFIGAYLAALRGAGAVLAVRGRPRRGRGRPASGWVLLDAVAPELREWSAFFADHSETRAAAEAGISGRVTAELATGLLEATAQFLELVRRVVHGLPMTGEAHVA